MALNLVNLPSELVARCWEYGKQTVADYEAGRNANSRAVTCFDAHSNTELQALARMAECAFCIWVNFPLDKLNWSRSCDDGADIRVPERIDIKHTRKGRRLIWPIGKNAIYKSKKFDRMVLIIGSPFDGFEIAGWVSKQDFANKHHIAPVNHALVHGTWFMDRSELNPMETFWAPKHPSWEAMWARPFDYPERI